MQPQSKSCFIGDRWVAQCSFIGEHVSVNLVAQDLLKTSLMLAVKFLKVGSECSP